MAYGLSGAYYTATGGSLYRRFEQFAFYSPGSIYRRFEDSNAYKMNREAIESQIAAAADGVASIFTYNAAASEQLSVLAAQQLQERVSAAAKEAKAQSSNLVDVLA